uniref:LRRNT_2 domain-containing protein n=1 Tax=Steinernema glaseri TaxID=37863 RepID=A0A1I8AL50_9BILA
MSCQLPNVVNGGTIMQQSSLPIKKNLEDLKGALIKGKIDPKRIACGFHNCGDNFVVCAWSQSAEFVTLKTHT